jgi:hypothetical protein
MARRAAHSSANARRPCYLEALAAGPPSTLPVMTEHQQPADATSVPNCPKCQGPMWDNRAGKRNPKAPDFKCKDRECDGVVWPARGAAVEAGSSAADGAGASTASVRSSTAGAPQPSRAVPQGMPACPICGGPMWDDRTSKRNPRAPDFKCRNKPKERGGPGCEGVIWPARDGSPSPYPASAPREPGAGGASASFGRASAPSDAPPFDDAPPHDDDDLPF